MRNIDLTNIDYENIDDELYDELFEDEEKIPRKNNKDEAFNRDSKNKHKKTKGSDPAG